MFKSHADQCQGRKFKKVSSALHRSHNPEVDEKGKKEGMSRKEFIKVNILCNLSEPHHSISGEGLPSPSQQNVTASPENRILLCG